MITAKTMVRVVPADMGDVTLAGGVVGVFFFCAIVTWRCRELHSIGLSYAAVMCDVELVMHVSVLLRVHAGVRSHKSTPSILNKQQCVEPLEIMVKPRLEIY